MSLFYKATHNFQVHRADWVAVFAVMVGYAVFNFLYAWLTHSPLNEIRIDYIRGVSRILEGEPLDARYPPLQIYWSVLRVLASREWGISYLHLSILLYTGISAVNYLQIKKLSSFFTSNPKIQRLCGIAYPFYPLHLIAVQADLAEMTYSTFFIASLNALFGMFAASSRSGVYKKALLSGVFLGIAALIRPNPLLFPLLLGIPLFIFFIPHERTVPLNEHKTRFAAWLLVIAAFFTTISPWSVYASQVSGHTVLLSTGFLPSHRDGFRRFPPHFLPETVNHRMRSIGAVVEFHTSSLIEKTGPYLTAWFKKIFHCWYASDSGRWEWVFLVINGVYILAAVPGWKACMNGRRHLAPILTLILIYYWALSTLVLSIARYQTPLFSLIGIFAVIGVYRTSTYHLASNKTSEKNAKPRQADPQSSQALK